MAQSPDPRYRYLHKSIIGGVFTCVIGFFLASDGTALLVNIDPIFARFRDLAMWIGWFFVAIGAFNIAKSVAGLFKLDRENRSARKAVGKQAEARETPSENPGQAPAIRGGWLLFFGGLLLFGFHNLLGFNRDFLAKYAAQIHAAGWVLLALGLLVNSRLIIGWIKAGLALLRSASPARNTGKPGAGKPPEPAPPSPPTPSSRAAVKEKPKHERRPIVERRR